MWENNEVQPTLTKEKPTLTQFNGFCQIWDFFFKFSLLFSPKKGNDADRF